MSELKKEIGYNIRKERIARNISIEELAEMLELSPAFIGLIERGQRGASLKNLIKISEIFHMNIDSLIAGYFSNYVQVTEHSKLSTFEKKKETIRSLLFDLNESELEFVISTIRSLKQLKYSSRSQESLEISSEGVDY